MHVVELRENDEKGSILPPDSVKTEKPLFPQKHNSVSY